MPYYQLSNSLTLFHLLLGKIYEQKKNWILESFSASLKSLKAKAPRLKINITPEVIT